MSWEAHRWGTFPDERLAVLVERLKAAGHPVSRIVNGKPQVDLPDSELEAMAMSSRPGMKVEGPARARPKGETVAKKTTTKPRKGRARKSTKKKAEK